MPNGVYNENNGISRARRATDGTLVGLANSSFLRAGRFRVDARSWLTIAVLQASIVLKFSGIGKGGRGRLPEPYGETYDRAMNKATLLPGIVHPSEAICAPDGATSPLYESMTSFQEPCRPGGPGRFTRRVSLSGL